MLEIVRNKNQATNETWENKPIPSYTAKHLGAFASSDNAVGLKKWVLVKQYQLNNNSEYYVGQIYKCSDDDEIGNPFPEKKSTQYQYLFQYTTFIGQAIDHIHDCEIISVLPDPVIRRDIFKFDFDFTKLNVQ